jgi:hypothetical protein
MTEAPGRERLFTTKEFDRWWDARGRPEALQAALDPVAAKAVAWDAWRAGREQFSEATASERLQPARR